MMDIWLLVVILVLLWFNHYRTYSKKIITVPGKVITKRSWSTEVLMTKYYPLIYDEPTVPITTYLIEVEVLIEGQPKRFSSYSIDSFTKLSLNEEVDVVLKINYKKNRVLYTLLSIHNKNDSKTLF